jgi:hypothetical protein
LAAIKAAASVTAPTRLRIILLAVAFLFAVCHAILLQVRLK